MSSSKEIPLQSTGKPAKPLLRGVSHEISCYLAAAAGVYLVKQAQSETAMWSAAIYSFCLFAMFTSSALYHRPTWSPEARRRMRRVDHSAIYLSIAGSATPFALLATEGESVTLMLAMIWAAALLGILKSLLWINSPKGLSAAIYVLMSFASVPFISQISAHVGRTNTAIVLGGAAVYILGAAVYAFKKPDPFPLIFGYHEIFHAMVILGAVCHYWVIFQLINPT